MTRTRSARQFLDPTEVVALFEALEDESAEVRIAAFEALTRLPLAPSDWLEVESFMTRVVGTIASVLGQRAAPVARTIATELASASTRQRPIAAAELLLAIRRKLLAKSELTALCLTAFGDADWQVGGG